MSEQTTETAHIESVLAEHEYALAMKRGAICACGFVPTMDASSLATQQDYHRKHVADALGVALGARTRRVWGVALRNGIYEVGGAESALDLSGPRPDSGPAVTCLRTIHRQIETPWVEIETSPGATT